MAIEIEKRKDLYPKAREVQGGQEADLLQGEVESKFILQNIALIQTNIETEMIQDLQRERGLIRKVDLQNQPKNTGPKVETNGLSRLSVVEDLTQDSLGLEALVTPEVAPLMVLAKDQFLVIRSISIPNLAIKKLAQIRLRVIFLQTKSTVKKQMRRL